MGDRKHLLDDTPPARAAEAPTHQNGRADMVYDAEGNPIEVEFPAE